MEWYRNNVEDVLRELRTDARRGLSSEEASKRREDWGPNELEEAKKESSLTKLLKQFTEFIVLVLIGAAVIAGILGEWIDSIAILAIVLLNGCIGFLQEQKVERVMEALKKLSAPTAKVLRDGELKTIPASDLIPGDIIEIDTGDSIPADCRILESQTLRINEAALTGESHPVDKDPDIIEEEVILVERINMCYLGTIGVYGRGKAVVVSTGMSTEMGKIARLLQDVKTEPTPLQKKLSEFARVLVYAAGGICALIFIIGIIRNEDALEMFLTAVSLAVAAIPEGLPAVVTIVLALGVQRMVKRHALIRRLPSVETLGAATIIATDKTGTVTQNQMTVKKLYLLDGNEISISGTGYAPTGQFYISGSELDPDSNPTLMLALKAGFLCNSAKLKKSGENVWQVIGDPTEGALLSLAMKAGIKSETFDALTFIGEIPFDSKRKMMTSVYKDSAGNCTAFSKGAPERILQFCSRVLSGDERAMTDGDRGKILEVNNSYSMDALRVLALAYRKVQEPLNIKQLHHLEGEFTFLALVGMLDPPREEVLGAVEKARKAGIIPIMITGDNKLTAIAIAKEIDIFREGDLAVSGDELDRMSEEEFESELPKIKVYARVNPEHKLKVLKGWRARGEIIAMTGDGVNDAPALKEANIGIAMGITGTDVSKEASDMILTDDNFVSIVSAVEEGRGIFDNIRRVVHFLLSCNIGEIIVLLVTSILGMPLPLLPIQILWTNLVTDGLPALGLAMEKVDPAVMEREPRSKDEGILTWKLMWVMLVQGVFIAFCTLIAYTLELYYFEGGIDKARTIAFTVLVFCQKFHVFNCRSMEKSILKLGLFTNNTLNLAVLLILISQFLIIYIPQLQPVFKVTYIGIQEWSMIFFISILPLVFVEMIKLMWKENIQVCTKTIRN